jgi:kynurenine formamidase
MTAPDRQSASDVLDLRPFDSVGEVRSYLRATRNWGRWGDDDQLGALNLITPTVRVAAAQLVREGRAVSLSRPLNTVPGQGNPRPVLHYMERGERKDGAGVARDFIGMSSHGTNTTHFDALSHVWDDDGLYGGVAADDAIHIDGAKWGGIDQWRGGIFTRGILLDIPRHRAADYVTRDRPVSAEELQAALEASGASLQPGDALVVYSGRDRFDLENPRYGSDAAVADESNRPGLDVSCLKFLRAHDCSTLVWDMTDSRPIAFDMAYGVHAAIYAYGMALIDSAELGELAATCRELGRPEFLFTAAPLYLVGGTATPVNPTAVL